MSSNFYYNIAADILAAKEHVFEPLIEIHGEKGAFIHLREVIFYSRFLKNMPDTNLYPFGLAANGILRPHSNISSAILAEKKNVSYMFCATEGAPDFGHNWIKDFKTKDILVNYYPRLLESL